MTDDVTVSGAGAGAEPSSASASVSASVPAPTPDTGVSGTEGGAAPDVIATEPAIAVTAATAPESPDAAKIARGEQLRDAARAMLGVIQPNLDSALLQQAAKLLSLSKDGALIHPNGVIGPVLVDYCLFDMVVNGRNPIQAYADAHRAGLDAISQEMLDGMLNARYTVIGVTEAGPGRLVKARDLFYERNIEIYDAGLAASGRRGLVLTARLVPMKEFEMMAGGALPIRLEDAFWIVRSLRPLLGRNWLKELETLRADKKREMVAHIVKSAIARGALKRLRPHE